MDFEGCKGNQRSANKNVMIMEIIIRNDYIHVAHKVRKVIYY